MGFSRYPGANAERFRKSSLILVLCHLSTIIVGGDFPQASELIIFLYLHCTTGPAIIKSNNKVK